LRVLIVDDELLIAEGMKREVEGLFSDALVDAATDASDAIKLAENKEYDVALLDVDMPRMDGLTLAKRLIALRPAINIIFVTGYQEYALEAHELYCSGFLLKPVGERRLKKAFENLRKPVVHMDEEFFSQHYQGGDVLGKKIKMYREQRGISRHELADLMNVTRQTVHRWEHGERIPDVLTFVTLARLLGVDINDILG
jgi:YesN/AraC family two-component response regulator